MHEYFAAGFLSYLQPRKHYRIRVTLFCSYVERVFGLIDEISSQSDHERAKNKNNLMKIASANSWDNRVSRVIGILEQNERV